MNEFDLLVDLHKYNLRQGPGSHECHMKKPLNHTGLLGQKNLEIADIGCGTGGQTLHTGQPSGWEDLCSGSFPGVSGDSFCPGK